MSYINVPKLIIGFSLFLLVSCITFYQHGKNDAKYDIAQDKLKLCRHGEFLKHENEISQIFLIRYNIEWFHFANEDLNEEVIKHCNGYNSEMETEIRNRFGKNIFKEVSQAAEELNSYRNKPVIHRSE